ncbi:MAG: thiamine diphosphokinase [Verrucomicrobia bacterium]|nr:thiamine diphosphokinase [Verrucomicrobiota bacterium]
MRVLLILGGTQPEPALVRKWFANCELRLAADSGFHAYAAAGLMPDCVTGDFDSLKDNWQHLQCKVVHRPEQTATDFEKATDLLPSHTQELVVLGGTGGRMDHFLTNLLIASHLPVHLKVTFEDSRETIVRITREVPWSAKLRPGTTVSLVPFTLAEGVHSSGLHWDLTDACMAAHAQLGQSNRVEQSPVTIHIRSGCLLVCIAKE